MNRFIINAGPWTQYDLGSYLCETWSLKYFLGVVSSGDLTNSFIQVEGCKVKCFPKLVARVVVNSVSTPLGCLWGHALRCYTNMLWHEKRCLNLMESDGEENVYISVI